MATAAEIVTRALRSLRVIASGEEPTADEMADGLVAFNDMLFAWRIDGIDIGHITVVDSDTLDVPDDHLLTLRLSLAERLGGEYGGQLSDQDTYAAQRGRDALMAYYLSLRDLSDENPLRFNRIAAEY